MPNGRRKVPFSGKAKKQQLQEKKNRKVTGLTSHNSNKEDDKSGPKVFKIHQQPSTTANSSRYALHFYKYSKEEIELEKEDASKTIVRLSDEALEISDKYFLPELDFPKRPPWNYNMSKLEIDNEEYNYFENYLTQIKENFNMKDLGYFEMNLETWRQFWRVIEMSDIILFIVDIRFPALMFPPTFYDYITKKLNKDLILILNKIDMCPQSLISAWVEYFKEKYPNLYILLFSTFDSTKKDGKLLKTGRQRGKIKMAAQKAQKLLDICEKIVKGKVNLESWSKKIEEELEKEYENTELEIENLININPEETSLEKHSKYRDGILTLGCIGQPNVGKSSIINALQGKKVVSISKTPGHTKHFQTIFLTKNVKLCDCPGLVFPSTVPKNLQVLMGVYPISQLRVPYSTIKFLAERWDLTKLLNLQHPTNDTEWSAIDICDAWATKRRYYTKKGAKLDTFRAANELLRLMWQGKLNFCFTPPNYSKEKDKWIPQEEKRNSDQDFYKIEDEPEIDEDDEESDDEEDTDNENEK